jgi:hypothetical protein
MAKKLRTMIYVDGYNLYYGCLKDTSERWLDVGKLCEHMLRDDTAIAGIRYFTALVKSRPDNPGQRQQTYLRALRTIPNLTIHLGVFLEKISTRLRADSRPAKPTYVNVWINEEKGSDVNLASYLLIDNFRARYDLAAPCFGPASFRTWCLTPRTSSPSPRSGSARRCAKAAHRGRPRIPARRSGQGGYLPS